ncbi:MAG: choice-of-anchor J domain-containing protein [Ignavibacteriaceae bacterium]|nr:choice-of-anchor J domain-containing protein [Ignavibacteriaceae bacterium]
MKRGTILLFSLFLISALSFAQDNSSRTNMVDTWTPVEYHPNGADAIFTDDMNGDNTVTGIEARGWFFDDVDGAGTTTTFQGNPTVFTAYEGPDDGYLGENYNGAFGGGLLIDQWLISPEVTVSAGDTLKFWQRSPDGSTFPDPLQVWVSTTAGTTAAAFDVQIGAFTGSTTGWWQFVEVFPMSGTVRFAVRYYTTNGGPGGSESDYIGLDYFEVLSASGGADISKLLLTEFVVTPTGAEFIEIFNPNASPVDLTNYFLSDVAYDGGPEYYYHVVQGLYGGTFGDFNSKFPNGATIGAGEHQIIALNGDADFFTAYGVNPTYEIDQPEFLSGIPDGIPDMMETHQGSIYGPDSTHNPGLTNGDEMIMLYYWDGMSDLVGDVDYVLYNSGSPTPNDEAVDKTGVTIDGPDPGTTGSTYLNDTPVANQLSALSPTSGFSTQRFDYTEGLQVMSGGNGVTGSDETSEDMNNTWIVDIPTPFLAIPVELTSFSATVVDETIVLSWITASETNNQGFEIQRSNGTEFLAIGFVSGNGTTTEINSYSYTDRNLTAGSYSYRLKQVDFDGTFEYSNVINVDVTGPMQFELAQNYPNPFNPSTTIIFSIPQSSNVTLKIFNTLGQEVATLLNENMESGAHTINFDASKLNSGIYFYRLDAGQYSEVRKMTLIK